MHRWTHKAAGGTIHRLKAGPATIRSRLTNCDAALIIWNLPALLSPFGTVVQPGNPSYSYSHLGRLWPSASSFIVHTKMREAVRPYVGGCTFRRSTASRTHGSSYTAS